MKFEIKARYGASILFSLETESLRLCLEAGVKARAYLGGAYLGGADLRGADLGGAYLCGAYLGGADLGGAYLRGADLGGAYLRGADLRGAYLGGAYLGGAYLRGAYLRGAYLGGAYLGGAYLCGAKLSAPDGADLVLVGERPFLQIGPIGSRADYFTAFLTDKGVHVRAGCFFNTLEAFRAAVLETHGPIGIHAEEYSAAIALIELHAKLWTPATEAKAVA